jgi:hypothetical protein
MIYQISNSQYNTSNYVCPDQESIDAGQAYGYEGIYSIGTETDANAILLQNQQYWLSANLSLFSVNKDIDVTDGIEWTPCDLNTEPDNTDIYYQIFNVLNGSYTEAIGLANAKQTLLNTEQAAQNHFIVMSSFSTWFVPPTTGTQTL